jgi:glutathione synthase/RimK-type ligase-like ATP-grasp enzyme
MRIAYLTCRHYRGESLADGALPPAEAEDFAILNPIALQEGVRFDITPWDAPDVLARVGDAAIIRSAWDYHERPQEFVVALTALEDAGKPVFNAAQIVMWNARKTYLQELERNGAPTIDTLWLDTVTPLTVAKAFGDLNAAEIVLKPQIGAGSRRTVRLKRNSWSEADLIDAPDGAAMAQPFLASIETHGELSIFLFGGVVSHVIQKHPARGHWYANVAGATFAAGVAPPEALSIAAHVADIAPKGLLYARIDLVMGDDGAWRVIELEAIEPYLFLKYAPHAALTFVRAIKAAMR